MRAVRSAARLKWWCTVWAAGCATHDDPGGSRTHLQGVRHLIVQLDHDWCVHADLEGARACRNQNKEEECICVTQTRSDGATTAVARTALG